MTTKLTLTIDDSVINGAKNYAKKQGKSLSSIIENYLLSLTAKDKKEAKLSPNIQELMGVIDLPKDYDYKKELAKGLARKYNL